jgi:hypothetical protein
MEFIAAFWWVWLIGLLLCGLFGVYKWIMGFFKTGGTILKAASLTLEGVQVATDKEKDVSEKAGHVKDRVVEEVKEEGVSRLKGMGVALGAILMANLFGLLFIIAIIIHIIDYIKA